METITLSKKQLFDLLSTLAQYDDKHRIEFHSQIEKLNLPDDVKEHIRMIYNF